MQTTEYRPDRAFSVEELDAANAKYTHLGGPYCHLRTQNPKLLEALMAWNYSPGLREQRKAEEQEARVAAIRKAKQPPAAAPAPAPTQRSDDDRPLTFRYISPLMKSVGKFVRAECSKRADATRLADLVGELEKANKRITELEALQAKTNTKIEGVRTAHYRHLTNLDEKIKEIKTTLAEPNGGVA